jgi:hypothetical protein
MKRFISTLQCVGVTMLLFAFSMEVERSATARMPGPVSESICTTEPQRACKNRDNGCATACISNDDDYSCSCVRVPDTTNKCYCKATLKSSTPADPLTPYSN